MARAPCHPGWSFDSPAGLACLRFIFPMPVLMSAVMQATSIIIPKTLHNIVPSLIIPVAGTPVFIYHKFYLNHARKYAALQSIDMDTTLTATNGCRKSAIDVFAYALGYMKDHMIAAIECTVEK